MTTIAEYEARRERLCTALESGRFPQIAGGLHSAEGYCCLGVASEVSGLGEWVAPAHPERHLFKYVISTFAEDAVMPKEVMEYYGFTDREGSYSNDEREVFTALWELNDKERKTFPQIAAIIRSKPVGLFQEGTY